MPTMAEVFNRFADEYQGHRLLSFEQQKLIRDIRQCRTYVLGRSCDCMYRLWAYQGALQQLWQQGLVFVKSDIMDFSLQE